MAYRGGNYSFVIDSHFKPFSMQEMLVPLTVYKEAYDKAEEESIELADKSNKFKYLSKTLPDRSESRKIYEAYAKDLEAQAKDLSQNGLSIGNRTSLNNLRRRFQGEIGRLVEADASLKEVQKMRNAAREKGIQMLYGEENPNIDMFLDGSQPNLYGISTEDLYNRGAIAGKTASSREYGASDGGSTLGGYYKLWKETNGISPENIGAFMQSDAVQQEVDNILKEKGVTDNLTGYNYEQARQSVLNGIYNGIVYTESNKPVRDEGRMSAAESARINLSKEARDFERAISGFEQDTDGNWVYNPEKDQSVKKASAIAAAKGTGSGGGRSSTTKETQVSSRIRLNWHGNNPGDTNGDADNDYTVESVANDDTNHKGRLASYDELPTYVKKAIAPVIGDGNQHLYDYYYQPFESGFNDTEASVELVPRKIVTQNKSTGGNNIDSGFNDIPE